MKRARSRPTEGTRIVDLWTGDHWIEIETINGNIAPDMMRHLETEVAGLAETMDGTDGG